MASEASEAGEAGEAARQDGLSGEMAVWKGQPRGGHTLHWPPVAAAVAWVLLWPNVGAGAMATTAA